MNKKWSEKTAFDKFLDIVSGIALCIWMIFEIVGRTQELALADKITYICPGIICVCQAISFWKVKRVVSYIAIAGAACTVVGILL